MQAFFANLQISINFNQSTALFMCKMMNFIKIWAHQLKIWLQAKGTDYHSKKENPAPPQATNLLPRSSNDRNAKI